MFRPFRTFSIKRFDFVLVAMIVALNIIGIYAVGSAAPALRTRQIRGSAAGIIVMLMISALDYRKLLRFRWIYYIFNLVMLFLVIQIGSTGGGAQRWIRVAGITFQPSELAKIILILFYAQFIMKYRERMKSLPIVGLALALILPPIYLILEQPDLSTSIVVMLCFCVMMFVGGISYKLVLGTAAVALPGFIIFFNLVLQEDQTILTPYQQERILAFLHPEAYADTAGYQAIYSLMAIGSGRLLGKGYNTTEISSLLNSGYISQSQTDFIFTVIGEEFGFIGSCTVVLLLVFIAVKCFLNARRAQDMAGQIIAAGVGAWIGFQGLLNIGVATAVVPNTGIPLPFVSYGLTSLLALYAGIGFILNVRMQSGQPKQAQTVHRIMTRI